MSIKDEYEVREIQSFECKDWLLGKHYAKRIPSISYAFGLYDASMQLIGVCTYGTPVSSTLRDGLCGLEYSPYVKELNRLVVNEGLPKNTLSFFVSTTLKLMPAPLAIVSYADSSKGHHGYIYQACNFLYTGLSAEFMDYAVEGMEHLHNATVFEKTKRGSTGRVAQLREMYGDKLYQKARDRKHRYVYFVGNKAEIQSMRKALKYSVEPYPKGDNQRYDASYEPTTQNVLF